MQEVGPVPISDLSDLCVTSQFEWHFDISRSVQMKVEESIRNRNIPQLRSALSEGQVVPWIC